MGRVQQILKNLPNPLEWRSFYTHDLTLVVDICKEVQEVSIQHYKYITRNLVQEAQRLGIQIFVGTTDSRSYMEYLIKMGVDGITTNRPDILKSILRRS